MSNLSETKKKTKTKNQIESFAIDDYKKKIGDFPPNTFNTMRMKIVGI